MRESLIPSLQGFGEARRAAARVINKKDKVGKWGGYICRRIYVSNDLSAKLVHEWRGNVAAIVGWWGWVFPDG